MPVCGTRVANSWLRSRIRKVAKDGPGESEIGFHLFQRPEDRKKPKSEADFHLFQRPEEREKPKAEAPEAPRARKAPAVKKPKAPKAPAVKKPESGPDEEGMRGDPLFDKFLDEKYQGGEQRVPNPNPDARDRYPDVAFSTAMKDGGFRRQVHLEFERWKGDQKEDTKRKRLEVGEPVYHVSQLRENDVIEDSDGDMYRVISFHDGYIKTRGVYSDGGEQRNTVTIPTLSLTSGRFKRADDPALSETNVRKRERAKKYEEDADLEIADIREDAKRRKKPEKPETPGWSAEQDALLNLARHGEVVDERRIGVNNANVTKLRTLKKGKTEQRFVWKPAEGEDGGLRTGIEAGTYHHREAAAYGFDRLLGEGTVVPPTTSTGDGSYQAFKDGARTFHDGSLPKIGLKELAENPDFHRINLLDAVLGNEDRHGGNIMIVEDESRPGGYAFIAIDNGLTLADPKQKSSSWSYWTCEPWTDAFSPREGYQRVSKLVTQSMYEVDPELHERLKKVKPEVFAKTLAESGIDSAPTILAALVRLSAFQRDPEFLKKFAKWSGSEGPLETMRSFLFLSGAEPQKILELAGDGPSADELSKIVNHALR